MNQTKTNKTKHKPATVPASEAQAPGDGLTGRQQRAVLAILETQTMEAAAKAAGVARVTLYEWEKLPAFKDALGEARTELYREGMGALKGATAKAVRRLVELLDSRNENTRRLTARDVLALGVRAVIDEDTERRIEQLEAMAQAQAEAEKGRK